MATRSRIILRIPGTWASRIDIIEDVARSRTGYLFADDLLYNTRTLQTFSTLVGEYNPQMEEAFRLFSAGNIDEQTFSAIAEHKHSLYLVAPAESPDDARAAMRASAALLTAGGIAILVESSGIVHTAPAWHALLARLDGAALYEGYVSVMSSLSERTYYTCGMHNLGRREAIIAANLLSFEARALMQDFLLRTMEDVDIPIGSTFPGMEEYPSYELTGYEPCTTFPEGNVYHNPYGMCRLEARAS